METVTHESQVLELSDFAKAAINVFNKLNENIENSSRELEIAIRFKWQL